MTRREYRKHEEERISDLVSIHDGGWGKILSKIQQESPGLGIINLGYVLKRDRDLFYLSGSVVKKLPAKAWDMGSIPGSGRSPREGNGNPVQHSCLENSIGRGAWRATVHGVAKSQTWLSYFMGFPGGTSGKKSICQHRRHKRHRFDPWVRKIPWRGKW